MIKGFAYGDSNLRRDKQNAFLIEQITFYTKFKLISYIWELKYTKLYKFVVLIIITITYRTISCRTTVPVSDHIDAKTGYIPNSKPKQL
jgi:hypothetical protein